MLCPRVVDEHMCLQKMFTELVCFYTQVHTAQVHPSLSASWSLSTLQWGSLVACWASLRGENSRSPLLPSSPNENADTHWWRRSGIHRIMNIIFQCRENRMREWIWHSTNYKYFFSQNWTQLCKFSPSPKLPRSNYFPLSLISHCTVSPQFTYFIRHSYSARGWSKDRNHHTTISRFSYGSANIVFAFKNLGEFA